MNNSENHWIYPPVLTLGWNPFPSSGPIINRQVASTWPDTLVLFLKKNMLANCAVFPFSDEGFCYNQNPEPTKTEFGYHKSVSKPIIISYSHESNYAECLWDGRHTSSFLYVFFTSFVSVLLLYIHAWLGLLYSFIGLFTTGKASRDFFSGDLNKKMPIELIPQFYWHCWNPGLPSLPLRTLYVSDNLLKPFFMKLYGLSTTNPRASHLGRSDKLYSCIWKPWQCL